MYRLCGGTFFTLLAASKALASRRKATLGGQVIPVTESGMLQALMLILNDQHKIPVFQRGLDSITSKYKGCVYNTGADIPLDDPAYTTGFHQKVETDYTGVCSAMREYCYAFLGEKTKWLAKALVELVASDESVPETYPLHVLPDGTTCTKHEILVLDPINLPALLVGCLDYIVMNVPDNRVGRETIDRWTADKEEQHMVNQLLDFIGASLERDVEVVMEEPPEEATVSPKASAMPQAAPQGVPPKASAMPQGVPPKASAMPQGVSPKESAMPQGVPPKESAMPQGVPPKSSDMPQAAPQGASPVGWQGAQTFMNTPAFSGLQGYFYGMNLLGNTIQNLNYYNMPGSGGTSLFELGQLSSEYFNLFVVEGDTLSTGSFTIAKELCLTCTDEQDRARLLMLGEGERRILTNIPAVFATPNHKMKQTDEVHMAILGRVTEIRVQTHDIRLQWKPYGIFRQQVLNEYPARFSIWRAPATNELDDEHWSVKRIPLIDSLRAAGIDINTIVR